MTPKSDLSCGETLRARGSAGFAAAKALLILAGIVVSQHAGGALAQSAEDHPYFADEYQIGEGRGEATISVVRDSGAGSVRVTFATKPSDATEGADYLPVLGDLTFPAGDTGPKTFKVPIVDDPEPEEDETVLLLLYNAAGEAIDFSELVIVSNEGAVEDGDDPPGSSSGNSSLGDGSRPGSARAGSPAGTARGGPGANVSPGGPSQPGLAPGEIPTILLAPQSDGAREQSKTKGRSASLAAKPQTSSRPIKLLFGLSGAGLAAGVAALLWLRTRKKKTPTAT